MSFSRHYPFRSTNLSRQSLAGVLSQLDQAVGMVDPSVWCPRVDVRESAEDFTIQADLPGIDPDAIDIQTDKQVLSIQGERALEGEEGEGEVVRSERYSGTFHRRFALPESADLENIQASYENGVLQVTIPKRAEEKPRRIQVKVQGSTGEAAQKD